ncbi:hypothetical protein SDRG_13746 [Saprolegnia diclina VS20]|uniref:Uncharacterized protein n=1 Tax=Saprolegnia diclina (strain VS20) TaxID=1156394 RepID=T0R8M1_SAPDV|nr:hypothetical protein SDRG_13746 [Saprolegnia diclina VS20]EQC28418.1 hypothetical protein SDRG_13746 [Saprolegnia diclina VS20]|eukprot:XP_008618066.1 hypothetical protein SDRG_13746 [Saprolegnia diclina VS20]
MAANDNAVAQSIIDRLMPAIPRFIFESLRTDPMLRLLLCGYVICVVLILAPLVLVPLCICLKVDGLIAAPWRIALTPLWGFEALCIAGAFAGLFVEDSDAQAADVSAVIEETDAIYLEEGANKSPKTYGTTDATVDAAPKALDDDVADAPQPTSTRPKMMLSTREFVGGTCTCIVHFLVALRMDGVFECAWIWLFLAFVASDVIGGPEIGGTGLLVQYLLIFLKLDNTLTWSWAVILIPTWFAIGVVVLLLPCFVYIAAKEFDVVSPPAIAAFSLAGLVAAGAIVASLVLITLKLQGADTYSAFETCLPYFASLILLIAIGALAIFMFWPIPPPQVEEGEAIAEDETAASTTTDALATTSSETVL